MSSDVDWTKVPLPDLTDPELAPYWEAARREQLVARRCGSCDRPSWPPRAACPHCGSLDLSWCDIAGTGQLFTWTVIGHTSIAGFKEALPFAVGIVEVDGAPGVRMVGRILSDPAELAIDAPVEVGFVRIDDRVTIPLWRLKAR
jgi:hypothetical protein